jgi:hypothetical protein
MDGLQTIHHPRQIAGKRQVTTGQLLQRADTRFAVIDRMELVQEQQFGQLRCIFTVVLVANAQQAFLRESQTNTSPTWGFRRSCNQAAHVPSSKLTRKLPRRP